jgi:hypothetical protein
MDAVLNSFVHHVEMRIDHIEMRIYTERDRKKAGAIRRVAVEKIPIIEIPIRPGIRDGFGHLVNGVIVTAA